MKTYNWLFSSYLSKVLATLVLAFAWSSCADETPSKPALPASAAGSTQSGSSSYTYPSQTINFSDDQGTYSYVITPTVTWSGSTTTWVYQVTGVDGTFNVRTISHVSFAGFGSCFQPTSVTSSSGTPGYTHEGNTGCMDKDTDVLKIEGVTGSSVTITMTYNQALEASDGAASMYVKTAQVCDSKSIPGASCNTLGFTGKITELYCDGDQSKEQAVAGATVTASQDGQTDHTTTTDSNGNYSFDNLGGTWNVTAVGNTVSVTLGHDGDVSNVNFTRESRPNGSCYQIKGSVEKFDCNGTTSVQTLTGPVTLTGTNYHTSVDAAGGTYTIANVPIGEYTVTFAGQSKPVSVSSTSGSTNDVNFSVDNRINSSCAVISGSVDLTQCLNQSSSGPSPVSGASVTLTGTSYSSGPATTTNGSFTFANVPNGTYDVVVSGHDASGNAYQATQSVTVANSGGSYSPVFHFDTSNNGACGSAPACSLSQGYWFAKPQAVWPNNGTVTLGGKVYTQSEGKAIWNTSNKGGMLNAKQAFTQATAVKLSNVAATASVWADVIIIDAYFASIPKMSATSIPKNSAANAAAGAAAGRIGSWIDSNHCAETN